MESTAPDRGGGRRAGDNMCLKKTHHPLHERRNAMHGAVYRAEMRRASETTATGGNGDGVSICHGNYIECASYPALCLFNIRSNKFN